MPLPRRSGIGLVSSGGRHLQPGKPLAQQCKLWFDIAFAERACAITQIIVTEPWVRFPKGAKGQYLCHERTARLVAQPFNVFPLVGCANAGEYAANAAALDLALTADEVKWLETGERA